eukprot:CAMPEP_0206445862 /NCGR_PEP_ID=MMETSP0324_2-20121206/15780_1 /ASSEMBLY_ACC=CAM_ASM_000836 /TAXON_ID=2866 /ORGANISM="Crypthecodinium cohnii, Strain Seligo" /LENGTH=788 /DNA_ID=CAMNT_0053914197 /DNA_START=107 /DNA_END=2473 /DNA_ORIENTATION=+
MKQAMERMVRCEECWEAVKCSTCNRHDPQGTSLRGSWCCRSCQQSQRSRGVELLKEHCHQSIIEEASNETKVVASSWEDLIPPNGQQSLRFFDDDADDDEDEEGDELAPLPGVRTGGRRHPARASAGPAAAAGGGGASSKQTQSSSGSSLGSWVQVGAQSQGHGGESGRSGHIVLALDASGSMRCTDVYPGEAASMDRLQAGFLSAVSFVNEHTKLHPHDVFSVLTFSDRVDRVCRARSAGEAIKAMEKVYIRGARGTKFKPALEEAARCLLSTTRQRDGHIVWLSDGKPSDIKSALATFQEYFVQSPKLVGTKFHGIGIGLSVDSFVALQQYVCITGGTFLLSGSNLRSLSKAFSSVSSTITAIRDDASQEASRPSSLGSWVSINEDGGGGANGGAKASAAGDDPATLKSSRQAREVVYEHPELVQSFTAKGGGTLTLSVQRSTFAFDGQVFQRQDFEQREVQRRRRPFMRGGMRLVYGFKDGEAAKNGWLVAKLSRFRDPHCNTVIIAEGHAKSTAVATHYANLFNEKTRKLRDSGKDARAHALSAQLIFVPCYIYRTIESSSKNVQVKANSNEDAEAFAAERYLPGVFLKYNSNNGFVNDNGLLHQSVVQAFLHFSFVESRGNLLVADLQGVAREGEVLLTDPQVLTASASACDAATFGPGDVGLRGMHNCLASHRCGMACKLLGLKPISALLLKRMKMAAAAEAAIVPADADTAGAGAASAHSVSSARSATPAGWDRVQPLSQSASDEQQAGWERLSEYNLTDLAGSEVHSEISASSWVHLLDT